MARLIRRQRADGEIRWVGFDHTKPRARIPAYDSDRAMQIALEVASSKSAAALCGRPIP